MMKRRARTTIGKPLVGVIKSEFHRNGVSGAGFRVTIFKNGETGRTCVGIRFDQPGHVAVFDLELLAKQVIEFGVNSFRGDVFEAELPTPDGQIFSPIPAHAIAEALGKTQA